MKLNYNSIKDSASWEKAGVTLPSYDWAKMSKATLQNPSWVHFGAGNIFRGFIAELAHRLLEQGESDLGVIAAESFDFDIIDKIYDPQDGMCLMVTLLPDGNMGKSVIASVAKGVKASQGFAEHWQSMISTFENPSLQMVSFTITEKGYALQNLDGEFFPVVESDFSGGPDACMHVMSLVTSLLHRRFLSGGAPIAMVSMDNCSHNGERLRGSVLSVAKAWQQAGFVTTEFVTWLSDEGKVSFPWSMIDKIIPRPAPDVQEMLGGLGIEGMEPVVTSKNTFIAPFVNGEAPQYLVVEDRFPAGRPPLEKAGVYFTDRQTVNDTERMKVTTCLNPLHTALAVYGCLLGYDRISKEMADPELLALVNGIGQKEGLPVVTDPGIIKPLDFLREVVDVRLPNPFLPDTPQRIATDTSQKVGIRFGETIKSYAADSSLELSQLVCIPLAIAGWLRYLLAVDDLGNPMECSPDPMLSQLQSALSGVTVGSPDSLGDKLDPILSNEILFGSDLVKLGLSSLITDMTRQMLSGNGAVRATLKRYLNT